MRGKALAARRRKNQELAKFDLSNRCPVCKRALERQNTYVIRATLLDARHYCSLACAEEMAMRDTETR